MAKPGFFPILRQGVSDLQSFAREVVTVVNNVASGKMNAVSEITLDTSTASTTLTDVRLGVGSVVLFDPMDSNAATELAAGTMYCAEADRGSGAWVITHSSSANARKFSYLVIG